MTRMSADDRRESVLDAAVAEFARGGLAGTSTEAIASRAGISQPYLFRLYPTKKALFIAAYRRAFSRIESQFIQASEGLTGDAAFEAMAHAYQDVLDNRDLLLVQLHAYAAAADADVQAEARACYGRLWRLVEALSGADAASIRGFFAMGMLCNVIAALDLHGVEESWARSLIDPTPVRSGK